jgi:hypothetical protein
LAGSIETGGIGGRTGIFTATNGSAGYDFSFEPEETPVKRA